jgi:hypothetical protein
MSGATARSGWNGERPLALKPNEQRYKSFPEASEDCRPCGRPDRRFLRLEPDENTGGRFSSPSSGYEKEAQEKTMSFTVKAYCQHGELIHRRKTAEAALKKARDLSKTGCYDVHIITPEGRDYASSEFGELPGTAHAL